MKAGGGGSAGLDGAAIRGRASSEGSAARILGSGKGLLIRA